MSPPTALNTPHFERRSPKPLSWVLSHQRKPGLINRVGFDTARGYFDREAALTWRLVLISAAFFRWPAEEGASGTVLPLRIIMQRVVVLGGRQVLGVGGR